MADEALLSVLLSVVLILDLSGMAFSSVASSGKSTYFENLIRQGSVKVPIFSFHLARHQEYGSQVGSRVFQPYSVTSRYDFLLAVTLEYRTHIEYR